MNESLFSRLFHYSKTDNRTPQEDYLTELLAWMIDNLAQFGQDYVSFLCSHIGSSLDRPKKKSQRAECSCVLGTDIGAYDTCGHLCRYCYANSNRDNVRRSIRLHNPKSPFLVVTLLEGEVIHQAEQVSWINNQLSFF